MKNRKFIKMEKEMLIYNLSHLPQLVFEVTDACNLKCKYCAFEELYTGYDQRENKYLCFDYARKIVDYLADFWKANTSAVFPKRLNIGFYGGEPLLNFNLIKEIIFYIESFGDIGKSLTYSMTTNGTLLDRHIDYLVEKDFSLLVSFDGDETAQGYRVYRNGGDSFTDVYGNVCLVREKYPAFFETNVSFNAVLHARNSIESVYAFFKNNFSKVPRISSLSDSGINKERRDDFQGICRDYRESFSQISGEKAAEIAGNNLFLSPELTRFYNLFEAESGNVFYNFHELLFDGKEPGVFPTGTCLPFSKKMFVTVNGKILQCERIDHAYVLGRITDKGVEMDLDKITRDHNAGLFKYIKQCMQCAAGEKCPVCLYRMDDFQKTVDCPSFYRGKRQGLNLNLLRKHPRLLEQVYQVKTVR